jgi:hypothetical protein
LVGVAAGQSTVTSVDKNGQKTSVTASCTSNGDCSVWDSTNDAHLTFKETREKNKWCNAQHISTKAEHGFEDYNRNPSPCDTAWKQRKADVAK